MTGTSLPPSAPRNPVLVGLDIVAGVLLIITSVTVAFGVILSAYTYQGLTATCGAGPYDGLQCNAAVLSIVVNILIGAAVLITLLGIGMFVVSLIRKRYAFWWPLAAIVVTVAVFYVATWVVGQTVPQL